MSMDRVGNQLEALGVPGRDVRSLLLLPQVYVGWASQRRDVAALEALLELTASRAGLSSGCLGLARGWLFTKPTRAQFQSGFALLRALRRAPESRLIVTSDLVEAMLWASQAARLDREPASWGRGAPVTLVARRALNDVEAWLEVDMGDVLTDLLAEDAPSNAQEVAKEKFRNLSDAELDGAIAWLDEAAPLEEAVLLEEDPFEEAELLEEADLLATADDEHSAVLLRRDESTASAPPSAPFPLVRRPA